MFEYTYVFKKKKKLQKRVNSSNCLLEDGSEFHSFGVAAVKARSLRGGGVLKSGADRRNFIID